jgi:hypothetical protein
LEGRPNLADRLIGVRSWLRSAVSGPGAAGPIWGGVHGIAALAFVLRYAVALVSENVFWPDEMYQYLEQGHRLVYGYGYIPWEFRLATRSWVVPGLIAGLLKTGAAIGLDSPEAYIPFVKAFFCLLACSVVYSAYAIGRAVSETAGRVAAASLCVWYELVYFAHKPTPEVLASYALLAAVAAALSRTERPWLVGGLAATALGLRFQYFPAVGLLAAFVLLTRSGKHVARASLAALVVVVLFGLTDRLTWGSFFASYVNNYAYNKGRDVSSRFGVRPFWYFAGALTISSMGLCWVAIATTRRRAVVSWLLLACAGSVVALHSLVPHKEYRFIVVAVPLVVVALALNVTDLLTGDGEIRRRGPLVGFVAATAAVSALGLFHRLPLERHVYLQRPLAHMDLARAYEALGHEAGLRGVLDLTTAYAVPNAGGAYYFLHRNVPAFVAGQIAEGQLSMDCALRAVSHVVARKGDAPPPGFVSETDVGELSILSRKDPTAAVVPLALDTFNSFPLIPEENELASAHADCAP